MTPEGGLQQVGSVCVINYDQRCLTTEMSSVFECGMESAVPVTLPVAAQRMNVSVGDDV